MWVLICPYVDPTLCYSLLLCTDCISWNVAADRPKLVRRGQPTHKMESYRLQGSYYLVPALREDKSVRPFKTTNSRLTPSQSTATSATFCSALCWTAVWVDCSSFRRSYPWSSVPMGACVRDARQCGPPRLDGPREAAAANHRACLYKDHQHHSRWSPLQ